MRKGRGGGEGGMKERKGEGGDGLEREGMSSYAVWKMMSKSIITH